MCIEIKIKLIFLNYFNHHFRTIQQLFCLFQVDFLFYYIKMINDQKQL